MCSDGACNESDPCDVLPRPGTGVIAPSTACRKLRSHCATATACAVKWTTQLQSDILNLIRLASEKIYNFSQTEQLIPALADSRMIHRSSSCYNYFTRLRDTIPYDVVALVHDTGEERCWFLPEMSEQVPFSAVVKNSSQLTMRNVRCYDQRREWACSQGKQHWYE